MTGELLAYIPIDAAFVRSKMGVLGDCINYDRLQCRRSDFRDVETADPAAALYKRHDRVFRRRVFVGAILCFAASEGFVGFNEFAFATERFWVDLPHRLANTVSHKPCGLIGDADRSMELVRRESLFARCHQTIG